MNLSQDIGYYQSRLTGLKSGCNFYACDVGCSCTELTTFKTSNLKKGRLKKWV